MVDAELSRMSFFDGLDAPAREEVSGRMRHRRFATREFICRQGML